MKTMKFLIQLSLIIFLFSCSDNNNEDEKPKSNEKKILSFKVLNDYSATINESLKNIELVLPVGTDLTNLSPTIEISPKAIISPPSGEPRNFSSAVVYNIEAEDGTNQEYSVSITLRDPLASAKIELFTINDEKGKIKENDEFGSNSIVIWLKGVTDVTKLKPIIKISSNATVSPQSGEEVDFTNPVLYTVKAENGDVSNYIVGVQNETYPSGQKYLWRSKSYNHTLNNYMYSSYNIGLFGYLDSFVSSPETTTQKLKNGKIIYVKMGYYDRIVQLTFVEYQNDVEIKKRILDVIYSDSDNNIMLSDVLSNTTKQEIITLDSNNRVSKYETEDRIELFEYDNFNNVIKQTTVGYGYKIMDYDNYHGIFRFLCVPQWLLLYTEGNLNRSGNNNPISIKKYSEDNLLTETITYNYLYDTKTLYPKQYKYQIGNDNFTDQLDLQYIYPFSLNLLVGK